MNLLSIAKGFLNATKKEFGSENPEVERLAQERFTVCLGCDTISDDKNWCSKAKGGCGCLLMFLVRSDKPCSKGKWK